MEDVKNEAKCLEIAEPDKEDCVNKEGVKCVDIYVENDISSLERMLGASPNEVDEDDLEDASDVSDSAESDNQEPEVEDKSDSGEEMEFSEEDDKELKGKVGYIPVLLSDFMEEDTSCFTYLTDSNGHYIVNSIPLEDKQAIKRAVKSPTYIFRYPVYSLKDPVFGYMEIDQGKRTGYIVYFPEYVLHFTVSVEYKKPLSVGFVEYFEDLVSRVRPNDLTIRYFNRTTTITSIKVIETGIIDVVTEDGHGRYIQTNNDISFHSVLGYIRDLSDQGNDTIPLKFLEEYFSKDV